MPKPFWQQKALSEMSADEWESLCDGCGKCCLIKLEDADNGDIYFTDVCCEQFNSDTCRCSNYPQRAELVPDCLQLSPDTVAQINSLPSTCAYRLLAAGEPLPTWPRASRCQPGTHWYQAKLTRCIVADILCGAR